MNLRIGLGTDLHKLAPGRPLFLGGINIPHSKGCEAHSDGDVVIHALCDALLGAMAMRDIGFHFPDNDPAYKNIKSIELLKTITGMMVNNGFSLLNADIVVHLEQPKIENHIHQIQILLAEMLNTDQLNVNVKAKTAEKIGPIGRGEAVEAIAVVLLKKKA